MSIDQIERQLTEEVIPQLKENSISRIYFYGAGLSTSENCHGMQEILSLVFNTDEVIVAHDLLAAAHATAGDESAIVCILGTGSNSGFYNGSSIEFGYGGNGYILGDEGSAADIGKRLLKGILDENFPNQIRQKFEEYTGMNIQEVRNQVYRAEKPNVYLASLCQFISANLQYHILLKPVTNSISDFLINTVCRYDRYQELPVHFVGSISYHYSPILLYLCKDKNINIGRIIEKPIEQLIKYHMRNIQSNCQDK